MNRTRGILPLAVVAALVSIEATAQEQPKPGAAESTWSVDGRVLRKGEVQVDLPCEGTAVATRADRHYVSCRGGGLLIVDASVDPPRPVEIRNVVELVEVTGVSAVGGEIWVETPLGTRRLEDVLGAERVPVVPVPPAAVTALEPSPPDPAEPTEPSEPLPVEAPPALVGEVLSIGVGSVVIDLGRDDGIDEGRWIEFYEIERVDLGGGEVVEQERRVGVGQVDTVGDSRAKVDLALNERVPVGALVRPDPEGVNEFRKRLSPARPADLWEVSVNVRPFLALNTLGGGAILDGSIGRRFAAPLAVEAHFTPIAFGIAERGDILTFAGNLVVSYDTAPFQVGLGAGASRISTLPVQGQNFIPGEDAEAPTVRAGLSIAQFARLGSVDGLHVAVLNNFILHESEFEFGGITIEGAVPIRLFKNGAWIVARGGGGVPGHIFGELGIRVLAKGNGGPGSVFFTPTVGAGVLQGEAWSACRSVDYSKYEEPREVPIESPQPEDGICREVYTYGGPLVGFGVEWRL